MAFHIIGSEIDTKVLERQNFAKDPNGLETIIEAYAIKTSNRDTLVPNKGVVHSAFHSTSPASFKKYSRMVVESVVTEEQDGGITQMLITFVGLTTSSGLPPAIVRLIPTPGANIYGPPMVIEAEYVTDKSETDFCVSGAGGQLTYFGAGRTKTFTMPSSINGTIMPANPREPFSESTLGYSIRYHGYCQLSLACERRGLFLVARVVFQELQTGVVVVGSTPFA